MYMPEHKNVLGFSRTFWRRVRDLNPRDAINVYTISSRAPSTTQPTLHNRRNTKYSIINLVRQCKLDMNSCIYDNTKVIGGL